MRLLGSSALAVFCVAALAAAPAEARSQGFAEKAREELPPVPASPLGEKALAMKPDRWRFAETDNFILNFRRVTEARRVAREAEFTLAHVARVLDFGPEAFARKSHIFIFEDEQEWRRFLTEADMPLWTVSFARGDELFLNVRKAGDTGRFDERTLAHEAAHAVVARLYPPESLPLWLHEGLAEYMAGESVAARKNQTLRLHQKPLESADMPLEDLVALKAYPEDPAEIARFYQSSERLFRFLCDSHPRERIRKFVDAIAGGSPLEAAVLEVYGDIYKTFGDFQKRHARRLN